MRVGGGRLTFAAWFRGFTPPPSPPSSPRRGGGLNLSLRVGLKGQEDFLARTHLESQSLRRVLGGVVGGGGGPAFIPMCEIRTGVFSYVAGEFQAVKGSKIWVGFSRRSNQNAFCVTTFATSPHH